MSSVIFYSFSLLLMSVFGVANPSNSIEWLVASSNNLDALRIGIAALLLATILAPTENSMKRIVYSTVGISCLALIFGNLLFPEIYVQSGIHFLSLDIIGFIEGSIICILAYLTSSEEESPSFLAASLPNASSTQERQLPSQA